MMNVDLGNLTAMHGVIIDQMPSEILQVECWTVRGYGKKGEKGWAEEKNWRSFGSLPDGCKAFFVMTKAPFLVIDCDGYLDANGKPYDDMKVLIDEIENVSGTTYSEISMSGQGVHIVYDLGTFADNFAPLQETIEFPNHIRTVIEDGEETQKTSKVEFYYRAKHGMIFTGNAYNDSALIRDTDACNAYMKCVEIAERYISPKKKKSISEYEYADDCREQDILDALGVINPKDLPYLDWLHIGMALFKEGLPCSVWDDWSRSDVERYKTSGDDSCSSKWMTFNLSYGWTARTIFKMAIDDWGWTPPNRGRRLTTTNEGKVTSVKKASMLKPISASALWDLDIPPVKMIIPQILPVGLCLLAAPPKSYKSYLCLDMCLAVSEGNSFMGFPTQKTGCLYIDLESTVRRPKERMKQILRDRKPQGQLLIIDDTQKVERLDTGFTDQIREVLDNNLGIGLVVIDVFQKIRPSAKKTQTGYDRDYDDLRILKTLADEKQICILLVHHTRKMKDTDDPFNEMSGSTGLLGGLDACWMISKEKRQSKEATLHITGRDLETQSLSVEFDTDSMRWKCLGTAEDVAVARFEMEYAQSNIRKTIVKLVETNGGIWTGSSTEIQSASGYFGCPISETVSVLGKKITNYMDMLETLDGIHAEYYHAHNDRGYKFIALEKLFDDVPVTDVATVVDVSPVSPVAPVADKDGFDDVPDYIPF